MEGSQAFRMDREGTACLFSAVPEKTSAIMMEDNLKVVP